jgi:hypothetical protein
VDNGGAGEATALGSFGSEAEKRRRFRPQPWMNAGCLRAAVGGAHQRQRSGPWPAAQSADEYASWRLVACGGLQGRCGACVWKEIVGSFPFSSRAVDDSISRDVGV